MRMEQQKNGDEALFARGGTLFSISLLSDARVLIAGCSSGGSQVALQLCMAGIRGFALFDHDILEIENVIRHACDFGPTTSRAESTGASFSVARRLCAGYAERSSGRP